jgi:hypothetical protein
MPTIYVAHEPRGAAIDLRPLEEFARANNSDIRFVFTKGFNISQHPQEAMAAAETFAAKFDFRNDKLVVAGGDPLAPMIITVALTHEAIATGAPSFGTLRYIRDRDDLGKRTIPMYIPIDVSTGIDQSPASNHRGAG